MQSRGQSSQPVANWASFLFGLLDHNDSCCPKLDENHQNLSKKKSKFNWRFVSFRSPSGAVHRWGLAAVQARLFADGHTGPRHSPSPPRGSRSRRRGAGRGCRGGTAGTGGGCPRCRTASAPAPTGWAQTNPQPHLQATPMKHLVRRPAQVCLHRGFRRRQKKHFEFRFQSKK